MALQRSRDRRFQSQQPPSILAPPPPTPHQQHQILVAPPQQLSPGAFHYYHHHHHPIPQQQPSPQQQHHQHPQQQQQQQHRHQVQFYQRADPILQAQPPTPIPVIDLSLAYRQRPQQQQQQQQQPQPYLGGPPPPHRLQTSAWDDRGGFRGVPHSSDSFNNLHHLSRLESSGTTNVALENLFPDPARVIPGYARSFDKPEGLVHRAPSHERNNSYWPPPFTSNTGLYPGNPTPTPSEVSLLHRGYHHSPSPQRLREHFLENSGGVPMHFESPRVVNSSPPRSNRMRSRSRSRSLSPVRFNRVSDYSRSWRQERKEDDDEREDGQLTPSSSPEIHPEPRRRPSYGSMNHRGGNQSRATPQKRARSGLRASPVKRPRSDDRISKKPPAAQKQKEKDSSRPQSSRNRDGSTRKDWGNKSGFPVKFVPVETAGESSQALAPGGVSARDGLSSSLQEDQACRRQGVEGGDDSQANAGRQVQEVVNLDFEPAAGDQQQGVENSAKLQTGGGGGEQALAPPTAMSAGENCGAPAEAKAPPAVSGAPEAQSQDQAPRAGAPDAQRQASSKQAVLTIRKNPSIPVAFKASQGGGGSAAGSKTWHRNGGVSKLPGAAGVAQTPSSNNSSSLAYVRKGNSLVRAPGSATTMIPAITTTTPPVSKPSSTPPLRAPLVKIGLKTTMTTTTSKAGETSSLPVVEKPAEGSRENGSPGEVNAAGASVSIERENGENIINSNNNNNAKLSPTRVESSEAYYKRKTNQLLLRNSASESSGNKREAPVLRTKLGKVLRLKERSLVWTLNASKAPLLLPWKKRLSGRTRARRLSSLPNGSHGSLLSLISKKLQAFRTSQPLYTRSANGFSLHRSGLRSVAGANLKWTKSLEKRSREANEEATKAVAAVEKRCRRDKAGGKARERIVMVGLVRYKMDPSTRTLQRLQDSPENSTLASSSSRKITALTPRRASIGGALYVRMGNGNQLVRDPKASSRALASEKVRWSLHKVRSRVSKKQQYCQFFTRFGRCHKGDSKCPYIHDSDKVVVCTKFLKGTCSNASCLLTHKVIPERMPDCSFFLQGLCINEECPYRHVNVNTNAPVCEGFLKGYCASGDQCNKKHTYVCPRYAAAGECPDRKACKLHHPKKKVCSRQATSSTSAGGGGSKARYFTGELPSHPLPIRSSLQDRPVNEALKDFIELLAAGDELSAESEPEEPSAKRSKPRRGLLCFNDMSEEEVDRLIKPAFVWQSRSHQEPVQV